MVSIQLVLDGEPVTMESCSACGHRRWHREGEEIDVSGVLADLGLDREV